MGKKHTGTREWSAHSHNIATGCPHGCRYCYARQAALRYKRVKSADEFNNTQEVHAHKIEEAKRKKKGRIMFPTTHDITPPIANLRNMLKAGNEVLVVSKPHLGAMGLLHEVAKDYKDKVMFRFTIGTIDRDTARYWEPNAPSPRERIECLKVMHSQGYQTSVSAEPLLFGTQSEKVSFVLQAIMLYGEVASYVTDSVWIGKLNHIGSRVKVETGRDAAMIAIQEQGQTDEMVRSIYDALKNEKLIRWKDSYKEVVGIEPAERAGLDR